MRPVLVGIVGGVGSGKEYFSVRLASLLRRRAVKVVNINYQRPKSKNSVRETADCILYHGLNVFEDSSFRGKLDVKVYLDVDPDLRLANLFKEIDRPIDDIVAAHEYHVQHVMKQKKLADIWLNSITQEKLEQVADIIMHIGRQDHTPATEPKEIEVYLDKYEKAPDIPIPGDFT